MRDVAVPQALIEPSCKHLASPRPWLSFHRQRLVEHHGSRGVPTGRPMVGPSAAAGAPGARRSWEPPPPMREAGATGAARAGFAEVSGAARRIDAEP
jgi:hypothetical protein